MFKTYLFLLAWYQDNESGGGTPTNVSSQDDLLSEYQKGNEHIFAFLIEAPNEKLAADTGCAMAFHENYTRYDTTSTCSDVVANNISVRDDTLLIRVNIQSE